MSVLLCAVVYMGVALSFAWLRTREGSGASDALLLGLLWPLEMARAWLELLGEGIARSFAADSETQP